MNRVTLLSLASILMVAVMSVGCGTATQQSTASLQMTSASALPAARVGTTYTAVLGVSGGTPPYTWVASAPMPPGLALDSSGRVTGTPTEAGNFISYATVTDSTGSRNSLISAFSVNIADQLQIATGALPPTSPGFPYNAALSALGGVPPYTWSIKSGSLPSGLTLNATTGLISGTSTIAGTSSFDIQVTDSLFTSTPVTTDYEIAVNTGPPRNTVIYASGSKGAEIMKIASDGSLSDGGKADASGIVSPTLPLMFAPVRNQAGGYDLESRLINPDYSTTLLSSSANFKISPDPFDAVIDPTGANLYLLRGSPDPSDPSQVFDGISIYTANVSPQLVGTVKPTKAGIISLVFTPDGRIGFGVSGDGTVIEYFRAPDGMLTEGLTFSANLSTSVAVSPDGRYLATQEVQIYQIGSDGSLTALLPAPVVPKVSESGALAIFSICPGGTVWDATSSYLLIGNSCAQFGLFGGPAILNFAGGSLIQTHYPVEAFPLGFDFYPQWVGTFLYGPEYSSGQFIGIAGYSFQNGDLVPVARPNGAASWPQAIY